MIVVWSGIELSNDNAANKLKKGRDKRYYTKYLEQKMSYIDIVKSEISEGYMTLKPDQTLKSKASNVRKRINIYKDSIEM